MSTRTIFCLVGVVACALSVQRCALGGGTQSGATAQTTVVEPVVGKIDTVETTYADGSVQERYEAYKDTHGEWVQHGLYTMWNEDGVMLLQYEATHGVRNGKYRSFYPSGRLEAEYEYVDDQPHGKAVFLYESGQEMRVENYVNGVKDGPEIQYYENGKTKYEGTYVQGKPHGVYHKYYPNGEHESTGKYDMGELVSEQEDF